jgi:hypothetical protein
MARQPLFEATGNQKNGSDGEPGLSMEVQTAFALHGISTCLQGIEVYKSFLATHARSNPVRFKEDAKLLETHYDRIADAEAVLPLSVIWKCTSCINKVNKEFVTLEAITRNTLAKAMAASDHGIDYFNSSQKYIRRASRIVEAAQTFGLVEMECHEVCDARSNFKPLLGTELLNRLMLAMGQRLASPVEIDWLTTFFGHGMQSDVELGKELS